jgi:hypothetical protein
MREKRNRERREREKGSLFLLVEIFYWIRRVNN